MDNVTLYVTELLSPSRDILRFGGDVTCWTHKVVSDTKVSNTVLPRILLSLRSLPDTCVANGTNQMATWLRVPVWHLDFFLCVKKSNV